MVKEFRINKFSLTLRLDVKSFKLAHISEIAALLSLSSELIYRIRSLALMGSILGDLPSFDPHNFSQLRPSDPSNPSVSTSIFYLLYIYIYIKTHLNFHFDFLFLNEISFLHDPLSCYLSC